MPKKDMTAAAETAPEEAVSEETTVTLPQAQLDAMKSRTIRIELGDL